MLPGRTSAAQATDGAPRADAGRALAAVVAAVVIAHVVVAAVVSTTRLRTFTGDSFTYVDVARHVSAGQGLVQSAVGADVPRLIPEGPVPAPMTALAPLFPVLIAATAAFGIPHSEAALLIPCVAYAAALAAGFLLGREIGGGAGGFAAVAALLLFQPLRDFSLEALSDVPATAVVLAGLALALRARRTGRALDAAGAGLACALAFALRYACAPLAPCAALALVDVGDVRAATKRLAAFAAPCVLVAGLVVARNLVADGTPMGPERLASTVGLKANLVGVADVFAFWALPVSLPPHLALTILTLVGAAAVVADALRPGPLAAVARRAPVVFAASYLGAIVAARTLRHFDPMGARFVLPAGAVLAAWTGATLSRALRPSARLAAALALVACGIGIASLAADAAGRPRRRPGDDVAASARLTWIAEHVTARDCVIGDDTQDVPFHFPGVHAMSFSEWPYTERPTHDSIRRFARAHAGQFERFFIVLRNRRGTRESWTSAFGPFVAELACADRPAYDGVESAAVLADARVFRFSP